MTERTDCVHTHDALCGYREPAEEIPCDYECGECTEEALPQEKLYSVTVSQSSGGTVTADLQEAAKGQKVTLTAVPEEGFQLVSLDVMQGMNYLMLEGNCFTMPAGPVTVRAVFEKEAHSHSVSAEQWVCDCGFYVLCGDAATWSFAEETGVLTISGEGGIRGTKDIWKRFAGLITEVVFEGKITSIGESVFASMKISRMILPEGIKTIADKAFQSCGLTYIEIPSTAPRFDNYSFENVRGTAYAPGWSHYSPYDYMTWKDSRCMKGHTEEIIPAVDKTCTTDGKTEGKRCSVCRETLIEQTKIPAGHEVVNGVCSLCGVYGTCGENLTWTFDERTGTLTISGSGAMDKFYENNPWSAYREQIRNVVIEVGVTSIGEIAFDRCINLTNVTIPNSVTSIGPAAFGNCESLEEIQIPDSVTYIGSSAFIYCRALTSISLPKDVASIDTNTFACCSGLTSVTLPKGLKSIEAQVFWACSSIESIILPEEVHTIGYNAFRDCTGLSNIYFCGNTPGTHSSAFKGVTATAWYPADNETWTVDKLQNYGGQITWKPYCLGEHTVVTDKAVPATCTESGLTEGKHCEKCGEVLVKQEEIPSKGHDYESVYTEPTYDADGFTTYTCTVCGDTYAETDPGTVKQAAASIGEDKYGTLQEAFDAAKEGDTIELLKTYTIAAGSSETWDLTGKTLSISRSGVGINVEGSLTIQGGTFRFTVGTRHLQVLKNGKVTIEGGTFYVSSRWGLWVDYGQMIFNGGTFYVTGEGMIGTQARFSGSNALARMTVNDGVFHIRDSGVFCDYGRSEIKGGTFYLENQKRASIVAGYSDYRDALTISGGTYYISGPVGILADFYSQFYIHGGTFLTTADGVKILQDDGATLGIYGGTFSQDMTAFLTGNYCCPKTEAGYVVGPHRYTVENTADAYLKTPASCQKVAEYYFSCACGKMGTETFFYGEPAEHSYENGICRVCGDVNKCGENLKWILENGVLTISGSGPMYDYTAENHAPWYDSRLEIKELIIEYGVTTIGSYAFFGCGNLTSVTIPESVISIGAYAFADCSNLKSVDIPDSTERVDGSAWYGSGMTSVVIGGDYIEKFEGYEGISEIWFRGNFPGIGENAFQNLIATAYYPADNETWTADKLQNYGGEITWKPYCLDEHTAASDEAVPPTCTETGLTEGKHCEKCGEVLVKQETVSALGHDFVKGVCSRCGEIDKCGDNLTWTLDENGALTVSGTGAMYDYTAQNHAPWYNYRTEIKKLIIENGVTTIGSYAFYRCRGLSSVVIPESVVSIGVYAFGDCSNLKEVEIPKNTHNVPGSAWSGTGITHVVIGGNYVEKFEGYEGISEIWFRGDFPGIGEDAFHNLIATAYYPADNETWTADKLQNYGGKITWKPYCLDGHTVVTDEAVDPTCTKNGLTEGKHCEKCGEILVKQNTVPALGHIEVIDKAVDATCTEPGLTLGKRCERCKAVLVKQEPVPALGHIEITDEAVAPTCTEPGLTEGKHCDRCDAVLVAQEEVPATGHSFEDNACINCGQVGIVLEDVPAEVVAEDGQMASLTVAAQGEGLTYKWFFRNAGAASFTPTNSFKGDTYKVEMNADRDGRQIFCMVSDRYGNSVSTATVTLVRRIPLKILSQPKSVRVAEGANAVASVKAQGTGLTYEWYYANAGTENFTYTATFKGSSYTTPMNEARNGRRIYCVIRNRFGDQVQTDTVTLSMRIPLQITQDIGSVAVYKGEEAKLEVIAQGDGLKYAWYFKNAGGSKFTKTAAFTGNTYSVDMDESRNGRQVYCIVTDEYGKSETTSVATITMAIPVKITRQPVSVKVAEGANAVVSVLSEGDGLTYRWYYANRGEENFLYTATFKGSSYTAKMNADRNGRRVYCEITDCYGNKAVTDTVTLSMKEPLKILSQPVSVAVTEGKTAMVTVDAQGEGLTYAWYYKNAGAAKFTLTTSFKGASYHVTMNADRNGRQVYCIITDADGKSVTTQTVTLKLKQG